MYKMKETIKIRRVLDPLKKHLVIEITYDSSSMCDTAGKDKSGSRILLLAQIAPRNLAGKLEAISQEELERADGILYPGIGRAEELFGFESLRSPIIMSPYAASVCELQKIFRKNIEELPRRTVLSPETSLKIGMFNVTLHYRSKRIPWRVSFEIEVNGERILFTGNSLFDTSAFELKPAPEYLLLDEKIPPFDIGPSEEEIGKAISERFSDSKSLLLVNFSTLLMPRLITIMKFAIQTGRRFIIDPYLAETLIAGRNAGFTELPDPLSSQNLVVYNPLPMYLQLKDAVGKELIEKYSLNRVGEIFREIEENPKNFIILFHNSQATDNLMRMRLPFAKAEYIHCLSKRHLNEPSALTRLIKNLSIPTHVFHRNANGTRSDIARFLKYMKPVNIIPIHGDEKQLSKLMDGDKERFYAT